MSDLDNRGPVARRGVALWVLARAIAVLVRPFGELSLEFLLSRDLVGPIPQPVARCCLKIRQAHEADLEWITRLYAAEPYLYLGDYPPGGPHSNSATDVGLLAAAQAHAESIGPYRDRLRRGEKCFIATVGTEVAHVNWLCFRWAEAVRGHPIFLEPGEAYTTDALTLPQFRRMNIHAAVLSEMLREAQRAGCRRAFTATRADRKGSFNAFNQLGWTITGRLLCFTPRWGGEPRVFRISGDIGPLLRIKHQDASVR